MSSLALWLLTPLLAQGAGTTLLGKVTLSATVGRVAESGALTELVLSCGAGIAGGGENCLVERRTDKVRETVIKADPARARDLTTRFFSRVEKLNAAPLGDDSFLWWKVTHGEKRVEGGLERPGLEGASFGDGDTVTLALSLEQDLLRLLR